MSKYLIVGLGNIGKEYDKTRHNVGWLFFDYLKITDDLFKKDIKNSCSTYIDNSSLNKVFFIKPTTFMNNSGISVASFIKYYDIDIDKIIVIHDDLDQEFGSIKYRESGGHGGHNGMRSIIDHLGTNKIKRIKIGISKPKFGSVSNHVLSNFSNEEMKLLENDIFPIAKEKLNENKK